MSKVEYDGIKFDSDLEVEYYKYLQELYKKGEVVDFNYHPEQIESLVGKRSYTPDFLVLYKDRIEIVDKAIDDQIHNVMLGKSTKWLAGYVFSNMGHQTANYLPKFDEWHSLALNEKVVYKKIKHLKAYGFVDWDFKNPNTLANKRKEKITDLEAELKEYKNKVKEYERFMKYLYKPNKKLTKKQLHWKQNFEAIWRLKNGCE